MNYSYPYPRMLVTVDAVIFRKETASSTPKILLIKRKNEPFKGNFALPGGFPEVNELLVDAAKRELLEETGVIASNLYQLAAFDALNRDPRDRNISVAYYGFSDSDDVHAGDDAESAAWFPIDSLPPLAFDHKDIVNQAISKVYKTLNPL
jgi:8-oxo-dGTP diphosphatase